MHLIKRFISVIIVSGLAATSCLALGITPAAACSVSTDGGDNSLSSGGNCSGIDTGGTATSKSGSNSAICAAGSSRWLTVKDSAGSPIYANTVYQEIPAWFQGWWLRTTTTASYINTGSFFWQGEHIDLAAAAMGLYYAGGKWNLNLSSLGSANRQVSLHPAPPTAPTAFTHTAAGLTLPYGATVGAVWTNGYPTITGTFSPKQVLKEINDELNYINHSGALDISNYIWPDTGTSNSTSVANWIKNGIHDGSYSFLIAAGMNVPVEIQIRLPGQTAWSSYSSSQLQTTYFPPATSWRANIIVPQNLANSSLKGKAATSATLLAALTSVVQGQIATPWNAANNGAYYVPALMFPYPTSKAATGSDGRWGTGTCGHDSIKIGGITFARPNATSASYCGAASVSDMASMNSAFGNPNDCWLNWIRFTQRPPALEGYNPAADTNYYAEPVGFGDGSLTNGSAMVGQSLSLYPVSGEPALLDPAKNYSLTNLANDELLSMNVTEIGITVTLGDGGDKDPNWPSLLYAQAIKHNPDGTGSYAPFTLTFTRTPLSRLQDAYCAGAANAAQLMTRCGIGFLASGKPYFQIRVHTWWDSIYREPDGSGGNFYCGTFSVYKGNGQGCTTFDADYSSRIAPWSNSWLTPTGRVTHDSAPLADDGKSLGWPRFGYAKGAGNPVSPNDWGAPMWDASHDTNGVWGRGDYYDIFVSQVQSVRN